MIRAMIVLLLLAVAGPVVAGTLVQVTVDGFVEFNSIPDPPLGDAGVNDDAVMTFVVDSDVFVDGVFPTRGYAIDASTFTWTLGTTEVGLQDPFPAGQTPYFVIRNDDPAVDGFFISTDLDGPVGLPVEQTGIFEQFKNNFYVTYTGDKLDSLDILDAFGTYDFDGLTVFNWTVTDGPFDAMGLIFETITIEAFELPSPPAVPDGDAGAPLLVQKVPNDPTRLRLTFDTESCTGNLGHHLIWGLGTLLPFEPGQPFGVNQSVCGVDSSPYNWVGVPPPGDSSDLIWFLILANDDATTEGSWGHDSAGDERIGPGVDGSSGGCGIVTKDLSNICGL